MDTISTYEYQPLEGNRVIRLVELSPALSANSPLRCNIVHVALERKPVYTALSYEWKGEERDHLLTRNGKTTLWITSNCHAALTRSRRKVSSRTLWIDAICINQTDLPERNAQVSLMADIYKSSQYTAVWLGEAGGESDLALKFARLATTVYRYPSLDDVLSGKGSLGKMIGGDGILSFKMLGTYTCCQRYNSKVPCQRETGCTTKALYALAARSYWSRM
jgi:hypothetical protein